MSLEENVKDEHGGMYVYAPYIPLIKKLSTLSDECPMYGGSVDNCDEPCCEYVPCKKFVN